MARILIVDDSPSQLMGMKRIVEKLGHEAVTAEDGAAGVEAAKASMPDLILMDLGLPIMDGWEATRQLKNDATTRHIPIIVLSAHAMTGDRDLALAVGGDDFDSKPIRFERLIEKIEALLGKGALAQ